jgi:hypothetical protein
MKVLGTTSTPTTALLGSLLIALLLTLSLMPPAWASNPDANTHQQIKREADSEHLSSFDAAEENVDIVSEVNVSS